MLLSTTIMLAMCLVGRLTAAGCWRRLSWNSSVVAVLVGTGAGLLTWWGDFGQDTMRAESWHLLGIFSAALLVNLPNLFVSSDSGVGSGPPAKPGAPPLPARPID